MSKKNNKVNQAITSEISKSEEPETVTEGITPESGVDSINNEVTVSPTEDATDALNESEDIDEVTENAAVNEESAETETEEVAAANETETVPEDPESTGETNEGENNETNDQTSENETNTEANEAVSNDTETIEEVAVEKTADPVPEKDGKWYICVGDELSPAQQSTVEHRVSAAKYDSITTPTGQVLVGPFETREDCIYARKMLIRKGVVGSIKLFD